MTVTTEYQTSSLRNGVLSVSRAQRVFCVAYLAIMLVVLLDQLLAGFLDRLVFVRWPLGVAFAGSTRWPFESAAILLVMLRRPGFACPLVVLFHGEH